MLLSGFTFIRNALKYDFPVTECIESMLGLVDELVVNVGRSEDGTEALIEGLRARHPDKIRVVHSVWDDSKTDRGLVLSEQTNIALEACKGRWALYLQADEALHEAEHAAIRRAVETADREPDPVEGLRFRYLHFYGGYTLVQRPWNWYPSEIRVVRLSSGARSYGDAQTFRIPAADDRLLRSKLVDAHVFHYGHARAPERMKAKIRYFHRFWHGDAHGIEVERPYDIDWKSVVWFWGTHPAPYRARVEAGRAWSPKPSILGQPFGVVINASRRHHELAVELKQLLAAKAPGLPVEIVDNLFAASVGNFASRSALVDLDAENRFSGKLALLWPALRARYARRIAHVPGGKLGRAKASFYNLINWGCHQTADQGFRVPDREQANQLGRWLGIDL